MWPLVKLSRCLKSGNENLMSFQFRSHRFWRKWSFRLTSSPSSSSVLFALSCTEHAWTSLILTEPLMSVLPAPWRPVSIPVLLSLNPHCQAHCRLCAVNTSGVTEWRALYEFTLSVNPWSVLIAQNYLGGGNHGIHQVHAISHNIDFLRDLNRQKKCV